MDKPAMVQRITDITEDLNRLTNTLYSLTMSDTQRYPENYEALSVDAAHRAEVITCKIRNLVLLSTSVERDAFFTDSAGAMDILIDEQDGVLEIRLPGLLPKKKKWANCDFLTAPFAAAMSAYLKDHPMLRFQHCVICFSHIYNRALPERRVRDYDNIEMKKLLDIAAAYLMEDDSGLLCDAYNTTELGDSDCMVISIMEPDRFPKWLEEHRQTMKSIKDF